MTSTATAHRSRMLREAHQPHCRQQYPNTTRLLRRRETNGRDGWRNQAREAVAAMKLVTV